MNKEEIYKLEQELEEKIKKRFNVITVLLKHHLKDGLDFEDWYDSYKCSEIFTDDSGISQQSLNDFVNILLAVAVTNIETITAEERKLLTEARTSLKTYLDQPKNIEGTQR